MLKVQVERCEADIKGLVASNQTLREDHARTRETTRILEDAHHEVRKALGNLSHAVQENERNTRADIKQMERDLTGSINRVDASLRSFERAQQSQRLMLWSAIATAALAAIGSLLSKWIGP